MPTDEQVQSAAEVSESSSLRGDGASRTSRLAITGGGTEGNEQLTSMTGVVLIVLLAVVGLTILRIGQLIWLHLFFGLLLLGPVALKMGSTGYRFMRYYTGDRAYREKGPPDWRLRLIAPVVVVTTVVVFVTGVILLFHGPQGRNELVLIHKVSFIVWIAFTAFHVLGHLPDLGRSLLGGEVRGVPPRGTGIPDATPGLARGVAGRWIALAGAVVGGLVVAIVLIPHFGAWTAHGVLAHHHHPHS